MKVYFISKVKVISKVKLIDNTGPQKKRTVGSGMETILFFCIFSR